MIKSAYKEILFNEAAHEYSNDKGEKYISVTTLLGKYATKFDTEFWSMYTALKDRGYKPVPDPQKQTIRISGQIYKLKDLQKDKNFAAFQNKTKATWEADTAEACIKGSNVHNFLEDSINESKGDIGGKTNVYIEPTFGTKNKIINSVHDLESTPLPERYPFIYERLKAYVEKGASIFAEKKVHLDEYKVAGMIDVPIFKGNRFCIVDWKTNKAEMRWEAGYFKKENVNGVKVITDNFIATGEKMLYPVSHLENSTLNKYTLQLSMYAHILEEWGYELVKNGLEIIHIRDGVEPQVIKIPYLKKEVQYILKAYKEVA